MRSTTLLLVFAVVLLLGFAPNTLGVAKKGHPNFVIFMVDDVGYGDIGCFGGRNEFSVKKVFRRGKR